MNIRKALGYATLALVCTTGAAAAATPSPVADAASKGDRVRARVRAPHHRIRSACVVGSRPRERRPANSVVTPIASRDAETNSSFTHKEDLS